MLDFNAIADKWQKKWEKEKAFAVEVNSKPKFYEAIVYPYMNGLLHLGHLFTYTTSEVMLRYKRMRGFNVLAKFGFHCTGTPIVAAAKRVAEGEPTQIETLKKMGILASEIPKFKDPEYWCSYFPEETLKDVKALGFSIDERYSFKTTSLNPPYDAMIRWQFNTLKEKGYVKQGEHPVVWDPKENVPVGDHDRIEGEGETPKDFIWPKFRLQDSDLILMAGTTRPDALLGQTNLWVDPDAMYKIVHVKGEKWVVGDAAIQKIEFHLGFKPEVVGEIASTELIGKWVQGPLVDYPLYIVPAWFIDANVGSGIVYSALEDPVDLIEIRKIQSDKKIIEKYGLDEAVVAKLKPIPIIDVSGMGEDLGDEIAREFGITSSEQKAKIEKAKSELNKRVFRKGVMKESTGRYAGMSVPDAQEAIKEELIKNGDGVMFYELTGKVVSRSLAECVVKIVDDQWFIEYNDPDWKKKTHECLDDMKMHPEVVRKQFHYVVDWLNHWACTREFGLGTQLPWDDKWVIESLSDSTFQMAYGTISKYLQNPTEYGISSDKLDDGFFDYVFLGKGKVEDVVASTGISKKMVDTMRGDFEYWYPFDFRNSAKDLLQNHLAFCVFNHTAIFPKKHWPKAYGLNGRIMVNNEKMSKSKGNFFTARELYSLHGPDIVRLTSANAGEGIDDANYDMQFLETAKRRLSDIDLFIEEYHGKGRKSKKYIDEWFISVVHQCIKQATHSMENVLFKSAIQHGFLDMQRHLKWYMNRTHDDPSREAIDLYIISQLLTLAPFVPHFAEECWEKIGGEGFISHGSWPIADDKKIKESMHVGEELLRDTLADIRAVLKLAKIEKPTAISLFVSASWRYSLFKDVAVLFEKDQNPKSVLDGIMRNPVYKKQGPWISKNVPRMVGSRKIPSVALSQKEEMNMLAEATHFIKEIFGCDVSIVSADKSDEHKASYALPGKPAILVA
ncbi:MAG: leucine--tRNA ligase [Nanoarchaeota archaeon]|nr:leucine--tRNA ligase [Nanoarchaeota archaeon]